jgi:hypothetical protein
MSDPELTDASMDVPPPPVVTGDDLSRLLVLLLKGVVYRESDVGSWAQLVTLQARARDYLVVLGLDLTIDEAEGYAFVRSRATEVDQEADDDGRATVPRLVARRQLSFAVSLLLALLRRKLAEFDARDGESRLVLSRADIVDLLRVFLPDRADEAKLFSQIDTHIQKVVDLGFLKRLGGAHATGTPMYEVRRIIKAFVDAQWLADFDTRLIEYRESLGRDLKAGGSSDDD